MRGSETGLNMMWLKMIACGLKSKFLSITKCLWKKIKFLSILSILITGLEMKMEKISFQLNCTKLSALKKRLMITIPKWKSTKKPRISWINLTFKAVMVKFMKKTVSKVELSLQTLRWTKESKNKILKSWILKTRRMRCPWINLQWHMTKDSIQNYNPITT